MSKSNKMFADKAFELVKELQRSSQTIPPFDVSYASMQKERLEFKLLFYTGWRCTASVGGDKGHIWRKLCSSVSVNFSSLNYFSCNTNNIIIVPTTLHQVIVPCGPFWISVMPLCSVTNDVCSRICISVCNALRHCDGNLVPLYQPILKQIFVNLKLHFSTNIRNPWHRICDPLVMVKV